MNHARSKGEFRFTLLKQTFVIPPGHMPVPHRRGLEGHEQAGRSRGRVLGRQRRVLIRGANGELDELTSAPFDLKVPRPISDYEL